MKNLLIILIVVYPQLRIKAGANVHLKINYEGCNGLRPCDIQGMMQNNSFNEATANHVYTDDNADDLSVSSIQELENTVKVFPNPTLGSFLWKFLKIVLFRKLPFITSADN
jgi:hypothetical protein